MANICEVQLSDLLKANGPGQLTPRLMLMENPIYNTQNKDGERETESRGEKRIHKSFDRESRQKNSHHFTYLANFRTKPRCC